MLVEIVAAHSTTVMVSLPLLKRRFPAFFGINLTRNVKLTSISFLPSTEQRSPGRGLFNEIRDKFEKGRHGHSTFPRSASLFQKSADFPPREHCVMAETLDCMRRTSFFVAFAYFSGEYGKTSL